MGAVKQTQGLQSCTALVPMRACNQSRLSQVSTDKMPEDFIKTILSLIKRYWSKYFTGFLPF